MTQDAKDDSSLIEKSKAESKEIQVLPEVVVNKLVEAIMSDPNERSKRKAVEYLKLRLQQLIDQPKNQKRREIHRNKMFTRFEKVPDCIRLLKTIGFQEDDPQKEEDQLELLKYAYERLSNPNPQSKTTKETSGHNAADVKDRSHDSKSPLTKVTKSESIIHENSLNSVQSQQGNVVNTFEPKDSLNLDHSETLAQKNGNTSEPTVASFPLEKRHTPLPSPPKTLAEIQRYIALGKTP